MEQKSTPKVYIVSAPFDRKKSGDNDYIEGIKQVLSEAGIITTYTKPDLNTGITTEVEYQRLANSMNLTTREGGSLSTDEEILRDRIATHLKQKIIEDHTEGVTHKILNLQLRPPDSGLIFTPEDLEELQEQEIKVVITCHEYSLNTDINSHLNLLLQRYFAHADHIIFFNEQDREQALKDSNGDLSPDKTSLSQVITTLSMNPCESVEETLDRPPNIIWFGSIRRKINQRSTY